MDRAWKCGGESASATASTWLLLSYKIPREPSAGRVAVWRRLKRLGALALQDALWVLPATPWTREQLQWLVAEIPELGGEAWFWEAHLLPPAQDTALVAQFQAQVATLYHDILAALATPDADREVLARRYQQAQVHDYFAHPLAATVRAALLGTRGGTEP